MKKRVIVLIILSAWFADSATAGFSEKKLSSYNAMFLTRVIDENREDEGKIKKYLNGFLMEGQRGIRLLDRFGMFLAHMDKKGVELSHARFFSRNDLFSFHLLLKDMQDGQIYSLYLEYEYSRDGICLLRDARFSIQFEDGMKDARGFFEAR